MMRLDEPTTATLAAWRSPLLGLRATVDIAQGSLNYWTRGAGPALLLVHGWLVNANHWRHVVDLLAARFRCITLDMPLGSHLHALGQAANLSPMGCGRLIADVLQALDLNDVALVGNDSGGAYAQIATSLDARRIARLVLTNCETPFDTFPPAAFQGLVEAAQSQEGLQTVLRALQTPAVRSSAVGYGHLSKRGIEEAALLSYVMPSVLRADLLRDVAKAMTRAMNLH